MGSPDSDGQPAPSRKRSRTTTNTAETGARGKKARGRPRVETQDENAADRRRTQIRLAQRAYRQRQETTISSLKDQNDRLVSIIEHMNKSFLQFNESALKSGLLQLNPVLIRQLESVTESFVSLAKLAAEGREEEEGEEVGNSDETAAAQAASKQQTPVQNMDVSCGYLSPDALERLSAPQATSALPRREVPPQSRDIMAHLLPNMNTEQAEDGGLVRYRKTRMPYPVFHQEVSWSQPSTDERQNPQPLPFGLVDMRNQQQMFPPKRQSPSIFSTNLPTPAPTPPIPRLPTPSHLSLSTITPKPAWTYSHDETTFARRLTRAALEGAFYMLSSATEPPAAINFVFRISLASMTAAELRNHLRELLARGTDEDLDCWGSPFNYLGGAGTHYPRKDSRGNTIKLPNTWSVRRIGPIDKKMIRAENSDDPQQYCDYNLDLTGLEGEWFDAYDVEGYLEHEKGLRIDPKSSFADVLVDDDDQQPFDDYGGTYSTTTAGRKSTSPLSRRSLDESDTYSFGGGASSADTVSISTPPNNDSTSSTSVENLLAPSNSPFGLNMDINLAPDLNKLPSIDSSAFFDQPLGLDLASGFEMDLSNTSLPLLNYPNDGVNVGGLDVERAFPGAGQMSVRQRRKKAALVDVSKLIDEMIKRSVCLGRTPGFRRKDVDTAFQASLISAS